MAEWMPRVRGRVPTADVLLFACVASWGFNATVTKYALGDGGFTPLSYAGPRFAIATLVFVAVAHAKIGTLRLERGDLKRLALWGTLAIATNQIAFAWSFDFASATTVSLLFGTLPIFAGIYSELFGVEKLGTRRWFAAFVSFSGVALVALGATGGIGGSIGGILLCLYAPASFALYSITLAPLVRKHGTYRVNALASLFCLPVLLLASVPELTRVDWGAITGLAWACLMYSALAAYAITNLIWFVIVDRGGVARASIYANLQPFLGAIFALLVLSEVVTWLQWAGGAAIAGGIVLAKLRTRATPEIEAAPHE
jgi:drug/metabolite transporter (DMT)-like permease